MGRKKPQFDSKHHMGDLGVQESYELESLDVFAELLERECGLQVTEPEEM